MSREDRARPGGMPTKTGEYFSTGRKSRRCKELPELPPRYGSIQWIEWFTSAGYILSEWACPRLSLRTRPSSCNTSKHPSGVFYPSGGL